MRAEALQMVMVIDAQHFVDRVEHAPKRQRSLCPRLLEAGEVRRLDVEFQHSILVADTNRWTHRLQDHQRESGSPRPRSKFVHVEEEPVREQCSLDRQRRGCVPWYLSHSGQVEACKRTALLDTSL